jgi:hypothetical protein
MRIFWLVTFLLFNGLVSWAQSDLRIPAIHNSKIFPYYQVFEVRDGGVVCTAVISAQYNSPNLDCTGMSTDTGNANFNVPLDTHLNFGAASNPGEIYREKIGSRICYFLSFGRMNVIPVVMSCLK